MEELDIYKINKSIRKKWEINPSERIHGKRKYSREDNKQELQDMIDDYIQDLEDEYDEE